MFSLPLRSNPGASLLKKKRVIRMLFVVVLEFFICWTPLYVVNTIALFNPKFVYEHVGFTAISFFQLLAYSSACYNPITYGFMNTGFRRAFISLFKKMANKSPKRKMSCDNDNSCTIPGDSSGIMTTKLDSFNNTDCSSNVALSAVRVSSEDYLSVIKFPCSYVRNQYL